MLRPYFGERCERLGYTLHREAFNTDNVPRLAGDQKRYFVLIGSVRQAKPPDHQSVTLDCDVTVDLYSRTQRDTIQLADRAMSDAEKLITSCMRKDLMGSVIKNVQLSSFAVEPFGASNDNAVIARIEFTATILIGLTL